MGAPMFGSTKDFVSAMSGQGMLGPLLASIGMKPVVFKSQTEFQKSITTESKMFSIYAVGVKKGYKRETRVQVHEVIDMRNAPSLSAPTSSATPATSGTAATPPPATSAAATAASNADAIAQANAPSTGGTIVYFRVE